MTAEPLSEQIMLTLGDIYENSKGKEGKQWANQLRKACRRNQKIDFTGLRGLENNRVLATCAAYLFAADSVRAPRVFMALVENFSTYLGDGDFTPEHIEVTLNLMGEHGPDGIPMHQRYWVVDRDRRFVEFDVAAMFEDDPLEELDEESLAALATSGPRWRDVVEREFERRAQLELIAQATPLIA